MSIPKHPILFRLPALAVCIVKGQDAASFLQNQLSNDITHLNNSHAHQLSAYCNPKGRVLALFNIVKTGDDYALIAPTAIMDKALARLKIYVMRAAVEFDPSGAFDLFGLYLPSIDKNDILSRLKQASFNSVALSQDPARFLILTPQGAKLIQHLVHDYSAKEATQDDWNRLDIEQNQPQLYTQNYEMLIPQSLNLDCIGGVNFKKGCYPGQEIIARVKYRGKPKTRMIAMQLISPEKVDVGAPVYNKVSDSPVGRIINSVQAKDKTLMSVTVPISHIKSGELALEKQGVTKLERLPLSYALID